MPLPQAQNQQAGHAAAQGAQEPFAPSYFPFPERVVQGHEGRQHQE